MDLLILRHGQSEWNAQGKWQGQADPPLTKVGEKQAKAAAQKLLSVCKGFDKIASSDLRRARRTAEIIAQVNGGDVSVYKEFRERHAGVWQGLTRSEIEASWPNAIADQRWPEGYESDDSVIQRVVPCLERLRENNKNVLLIAHAGVIRALDRFTDAEEASITNNLSGRWYRLSDQLIPRESADFSEEVLDQYME